MSNWWDGMGGNDEQVLKENIVPFKFLPIDLQQLLREMPAADREWLDSNGDWLIDTQREIYDGITYRLRPDWKRPEPEEDKGWVRYEVLFCQQSRAHYHICNGVKFEIGLSRRHVDFLGIEYAERPGFICMSLMVYWKDEDAEGGDFLMDGWHVEQAEKVRPATPKYIYFARRE
jgi:hypothetical protein